MSNLTISIFQNKIFFEIMKEIKLFSKFQIKYYDNLDTCIKNAEKENELVIFLDGSFKKTEKNNFPSISINNYIKSSYKSVKLLEENIKMPVSILELEKKIIALTAKSEFKKNSLIHLGGYVVDKNERKIKKNNLELQLSEKEINFLILFAQNKKPINRNFLL